MKSHKILETIHPSLFSTSSNRTFIRVCKNLNHCLNIWRISRILHQYKPRINHYANTINLRRVQKLLTALERQRELINSFDSKAVYLFLRSSSLRQIKNAAMIIVVFQEAVPGKSSLESLHSKSYAILLGLRVPRTEVARRRPLTDPSVALKPRSNHCDRKILDLRAWNFFSNQKSYHHPSIYIYIKISYLKWNKY